MIRHVVGDLHQIGECVQGRNLHEAVCVYVLLNEGHPILIDCGSQLHRAEMMSQLGTVLNGHSPEFIFLTHSELPHAGNLQRIAEKFPSIQVLVSSVMLPYIEIAPILPLSQIRKVLPGTTLDIAGRKLAFLDALLRDQPGSQWIFDEAEGALFSGDGFGYYHSPTMCDCLSDELADGIPLEYLESYHQNSFRFLRWVIPERFGRDLDELFRRRDVKVIAPTHGSAIRSDVSTHVERLKLAVANICHAADAASSRMDVRGERESSRTLANENQNPSLPVRQTFVPSRSLAKFVFLFQLSRMNLSSRSGHLY